MSEELYRAERLPVLQNRVYRTREEAEKCPCGDVVLVQHPDTGLIYNRAFDPHMVQYDTEYQNEQGLSSVFQSHLDLMTQVVQRHFSGRILEVGCGKGFFLERLERMGFDVVGIDPAYQGSNPRVIKRYFSPDLALQANGIILRHVLEHIPRPIDFLTALKESTRASLILIEVPCLDWIGRNKAWFDIFYEHVNYFRLQDFHRMFGRVLESGHVFGGQYLYVVADLTSFRGQHLPEAEAYAFPEDFTASVRFMAAETRERAKPVVIWGAASKGVIFSIFLARAGGRIDAVIDINPAKQNHYLPVTGLRVWSPEEIMKQFPDETDIYVMNGNYFDEVRHMTQGRFNYIKVDHA